MLLPVLGCEPGFDLKVENGTGQALTIFRSVGSNPPVRQGDIQPGEYIYMRGLWLASGYYTIIAKNKQGEIVYSKEFGYFELRDDYDFKVVISELDKDLVNGKNEITSDNVTGSDNTTIRQE